MSKEEALQLIKEAAEIGATRLDLSDQELTELPSELFQLTNLTSLNLSGNQLKSISPEIIQLRNLTELCLGGIKYIYATGDTSSPITNCLSSLPPELFELKNLTSLLLDHNQLIKLPPEIVQLPKLERLFLNDNPLTSPPYELAVQGIHAMREYFTSLEEGGQTLAEVKIILIGEGASGKTSLTRCLRGERFDPHEATTHGIRIKDWQLDTGSQHVRCKLWDFGGQEIMHATHQFFLSRRSLYVLVLDGRRDERPEYWLRYIESFGGGSPVLVVLNKYDTNPGFDLNRPFLQGKYPFIKGFWKTSCKTGNLIAEFKQALCEELNNVPLTKNEWPTSWFRAKARLEQMNEPRISYEKFETVCREAGVSGKISRNVLAAFLHDLGIVIHFDEFELDGNNILDPKWVTGAVYKIINAELIAAGKGLLKLDALKEILAWQEGDEYRYERNDYIFIINLMKMFELCYELNAKEVMLPQLLDVSEPPFAFERENALRFVLHYEDFLPPSVMPRFIVKRHHEIKDKLRWRSGVVLQNPMLEATAVVKADVEARRIHIKVSGTQRKAFLTVIMLTLREINSGFAGLKVSERIPLPTNPTISVDCETLRSNLEQGVTRFVPEGASKACDVRDLLGTVDDEKMLKILAQAGGEAKDKESFLDVVGKNLKAEPELFGFGINLKVVAEELWLRYRAKRGGKGE